MLKKVISALLSLSMVLTIFCGIIVNAEGSKSIPADTTDSIIISDNPTYNYGNSNSTENNNLIAPDSFSSNYAVHNSGVGAAQIHTNWRWFKDAFYPAFLGVDKATVAAGKYYAYSPNCGAKETVPTLTLGVSADTVIRFKIALRSGTASWADVAVDFSEDGNNYSEAAATYSLATYEVDCTDNAEYNTVEIRSYTVIISSNGTLMVKLPNANAIINGTATSGINSDSWAFVTSSVLMSPFSCTASTGEIMVDDELIVNESGNTLHTDEGRYMVNKNGITTLASINDAVCATKVTVPNWRWVDDDTFTTDIATSGDYIFSANCWQADTVPEISYMIADGVKASFKVILRTQSGALSFNDVKILYSVNGSEKTVLSDNFISYTEKNYEDMLTARSYEVVLPAGGTLTVQLPTVAALRTATTTLGLNSDEDAYCASSILMTPADFDNSDIKYISAGVSDIINDLSWFNGTKYTEYGVITGSGYTQAIELDSGWQWGNSNGAVKDILPRLLDSANVLTPDQNNPSSTIKYNVKAGTTLVVPIMMKSTLWDVLTDDNKYIIRVDTGSGSWEYDAPYVETVGKWSDGGETITNVLRTYAISVDTNAVVTISFPNDLSTLKAECDKINSGVEYFHNAGAFIYPAYGIGEFAGDTITKRDGGTQIHDDLYFRSNAINSNALAFSGGIATSKVVKDWHWPNKYSDFFGLCTKENDYVYTTAYDNDITPELYYYLDANTTVSFAVGIIEGAASWNDVKLELSNNGVAYTVVSDLLSATKSYSTDLGGKQMQVKYYELNSSADSILKITLPVGSATATNVVNSGINSSNLLAGYAVFVTPAKFTSKFMLSGDIDSDDKVSSTDLVVLRKILLSETFNLRADVNRDSFYDVRDLVRLKKLLAVEVVPHAFELKSVSTIDNGLMTDTLTPTFTWDESANATSYIISVDKFNEETQKFDTNVLNKEVSATSYTLQSDEALKSGEYYAWSVKAESITGTQVAATGSYNGSYETFLSNTTYASNANNKGLSYDAKTKAGVQNYLSRAMTFTGDENFMRWSNINFDGTTHMRDILYSGTKYVSRLAAPWGEPDKALSAEAQANQKAYLERLHGYDNDIIAEACIFEYVDDSVNNIAIPAWVFEAFGKTVETRNFEYNSMIATSASLTGEENVPDITKEETQMYFYYCAKTYIDLGYEALHLGQIEHIARNDDSKHTATEKTLKKIREYADANARRNFVLINAHACYDQTYVGTDGKLLFDFYSFPLRAAYEDGVTEGEVIIATATTAQPMVLKEGHLDSLYGRLSGGTSYYGIEWDYLPYFVEFDNASVDATVCPLDTATPNEYVNWGRDDISWFAHQFDQYRREWLGYAKNWVEGIANDNGYLCMPGFRPAVNGVFGAEYDAKYDEYNYGMAYCYMSTMDFEIPAGTQGYRAFSDIATIRGLWNN